MNKSIFMVIALLAPIFAHAIIWTKAGREKHDRIMKLTNKVESAAKSFDREIMARGMEARRNPGPQHSYENLKYAYGVMKDTMLDLSMIVLQLVDFTAFDKESTEKLHNLYNTILMMSATPISTSGSSW